MTDGTTFVCAIESGRLEAETCLMVQSLRRFGGGLSDAPIIAVVGRRGSALSRETAARLERCNVDVITARHSDNRYPWFNYSNKVVAIQTAERQAKSTCLTWLDSDVLITADPSGLLLSRDEQFAARVEPLNAAVTEADRSNEAYWIELCKVVGARYEDLPWVDVEGVNRLAYFNSGVFSWRRDSGFAEEYVGAFWRLLDSRIAQRDGSFFSADQVILSPVLTKLSLAWRHLAIKDHHMLFPPLLGTAPSIEHSAVLHYSRSMQPPYLDTLLARIAIENPFLADWLADQSSSLGQAGAREALVNWVRRKFRGLRWAWYAKHVRVIA